MRSDKKIYVFCDKTKKFLRKMPNGELILEENRNETPEQLRQRIKSLSIFRNDKMSGNGFQPHYSKTLGKFIATRGQLDAECRSQGFEVAGDTPPPQYNENTKSEGLNDSDIKDLKDSGVELSGNEAEFVKSI